MLPVELLPVDDVPPVGALSLVEEEEPPFVEFSPPNPVPVEEAGVTVPLSAFLPPVDDVLPVLDASLSPELRTVTDGFVPRPDVPSWPDDGFDVDDVDAVLFAAVVPDGP